MRPVEGYLESRVGQGMVVAHDMPSALLRDQTDRKQGKQAHVQELSPLHLAARVRTLQEVLTPLHFEGSPRGTYHGGEPAVDQFPYDVWARLIARRTPVWFENPGYFGARAPAGGWRTPGSGAGR